MNWTAIDILLLIGGWGIALICLCLYLGQNKSLDKMFEMAHETFDRLDSYDRIANKAVALSTDILNDLKRSIDQLGEKDDLINTIRDANNRLSEEIEELMEENRKLSEQVQKFMSMEDDGK